MHLSPFSRHMKSHNTKKKKTPLKDIQAKWHINKNKTKQKRKEKKLIKPIYVKNIKSY